ncbi:MGMT family protein [Ectopseudomonas mendocina]|uniref:MGMT family protein n=1 Tax=Ectopseudomonas mendocina TaxID=300 RepID=A0ABZ2RIE1_ECTME
MALEPSASQTERRSSLYGALAHIPAGKVVTYGQLAELAGLGRAARWVGRTLSQLPEGTTLPWHRVIASGGRLSLPAGTPAGEEQRRRLKEEGIFLSNDRVDMTQHGWRMMDHSG